MTGVTDDAMTVVWISSDRSIGWVEIAPDDGASFYAEERPRHYEDFLGRHVVSKLHRVRVAGLQAGTTYRYRIYQQGIDDSGAIPVLGTVTASDVYSREPYRIRTLDSRRDECRFMVVNDIHGRDSILTAHARAMRKHIRYFLTMSLSLFSHPSDRYDYKALALKPASDTAERMVSAGRSVVIVNVLSGDFKSIDHASSFTNLFNLAPIAATHPPHLAFVLNFNVAISLLII